MSTNDSLAVLTREVRLILLEIRDLRRADVQFTIVHRFRVPGTDCLDGEEIASVYLVFRAREHYLRLSLALRILFDYLARHSRFPQSAAQIELGVRADDFYRHHASNSPSRGALTRSITRSAVRVYVKRLREAISLALQEAGLGIDPCLILAQQETVGNEVGYQFRAKCNWIHIDLELGDQRPFGGRNRDETRPDATNSAVENR